MTNAPQSQDVFSSKSQSRGLLKKQLTLCTDRKELDIMVMELSSHDTTVGNAIGRIFKEVSWKVGYDLRAKPIDIKLHVQDHKPHSHDIRIESDGRLMFTGVGSHAKDKVVVDLTYQWPFRAAIYGINEVNYFEVRPARATSDVWYPATISSQRDDGMFDVTALEPNGRGSFVRVKYPAVNKSDLRDAADHKPLMVLEESLTLQVRQEDPSPAVLSVGGELAIHRFGRPSPPLATSEQVRSLRVSTDRDMVSANVGHDTLDHFVSGEVRSVKSVVERLRHS